MADHPSAARTGDVAAPETDAPGSAPVQRRTLLRAAASTCLGGLAACGERTEAGTGPLDRLRGTDLAAPDHIAAPAEVDAFLRQHPLPPRYRSAQRHLLQGAPVTRLDSRLPDGGSFRLDQFGPTHLYVDAHTGWAWTRPGGDWLDAKGQRHGPAPWFSIPAGDAVGTEGWAHYFADVTLLVQHTQAHDRWLALLTVARGARRTIAGMGDSPHGAPAIDVVYVDGQRERLRCRVAAPLDPSSTQPNTVLAELSLPAALEFERPRAAVASAKLRFTVTRHWGGRSPVIEAFLLDPPVNDAPLREGIAQTSAPLDAGLERHPAVLGCHRYLDGRPMADFVHGEAINFNAEREFDPVIYGTGPSDTRRLPHAGLGKWINAGSNWALVSSQHAGDGFAPLAPGMGALRLAMPAAPGVGDGAVVGNGGTLAGHAMIFLPEPLFGLQDHLFVRYYVRLGLPYRAEPRDRKQVYHGPGQAAWTNMSGKFGIGPDHTTALGGVSGSSGGGAGWQMRLSWYECDAGLDGPDERGWAPGFHLSDFQGNNPVGHRYGKEQPTQFERWGQGGGMGGVLYAGHWYCVETELKLNRVMNEAPGHQADGALRAWIDGRLVYQRTGMVFRSLPLQPGPQPHLPQRTRPCRELGIRGLWLNWFHGGQTRNTIDRSLFYTGLAWGTEYIGPMRR